MTSGRICAAATDANEHAGAATEHCANRAAAAGAADADGPVRLPASAASTSAGNADAVSAGSVEDSTAGLFQTAWICFLKILCGDDEFWDPAW